MSCHLEKSKQATKIALVFNTQLAIQERELLDKILLAWLAMIKCTDNKFQKETKKYVFI
jgi:hypothetical protein